MSDYAELRAALESATPGPWKASEHQWPEQVGCCPLVGRPYSICGMDRKNIAAATSFGTAVYIAAANPEAIRALLAERDTLATECQEQARLNGMGAEREARLMAERDALRVVLEDELIWHEAQDKAISKQPNANTGHTWWRRAQHQEHAVVIRAALGQEES